MKPLDLTGQTFARLTAVHRVPNLAGYGQARWLFKCECGGKKITFGYSVVHGKTRSCGCLLTENKPRLKHGRTGTTEFTTWAAIRQRCGNPLSKPFKHYGGRGITVDKRWDTFEAFFQDMGPRPPGATLERTDNDLGYSPDNCRWATRLEQVRNRRTTTFYEHEGQNLSLQAWAERIGVSYKTLWSRFKVGKRGHDLLTPLVRAGGRPLAHS